LQSEVDFAKLAQKAAVQTQRNLFMEEFTKSMGGESDLLDQMKALGNGDAIVVEAGDGEVT
jgi:hypothetical protein